LELAQHGIRVNGVAPGMMDTGMLHSLRSDLDKVADGSAGGQPNVASIPLGRIAQPEEIAPTVLYLAGDASAYITGQTVNVCGGIAMS
jgi:NAD(P)-dependent dehydrogenase (short-subunit alcohol dehydrogenase family)